MKILQLIDLYKDGGAEKVYDLCASYFSKQNFIVEKYCLYKSNCKKNDLNFIINKSNPLLFIGKYFDQKKAKNRIYKIVKNKSIEQVISFLDRSNIIIIDACKKLSNKPKVTVTVHNPPTLQYLKLNRVLQFFVYKTIARKYNKKWVKVVAVSETIRNSLLSIGVKDVNVIYNPFSIDSIKLSESINIDNKDYFLAIGRMENQKAYWKLLKAYCLYLNNEDSNQSDLYLLGDGSHKDKLMNLASSLGIDNKVHFEGYISNPFPYLKNCKCLVFSSLYEGFPVTLVESFSQVKPYIGSENSIPIEYRNYLSKNGISCTYRTEQFDEDYSTALHTDERCLCDLMLKVEKDTEYKNVCANLGYEWFKNNCSLTNFEQYIH